MVILNKFIYKRRAYIRATNGYYKYIYIKDATISEQPMVIINKYI